MRQQGIFPPAKAEEAEAGEAAPPAGDALGQDDAVLADLGLRLRA